MAEPTLNEESQAYVDSEEYALAVRNTFNDHVNNNPALKAHRDHVEKHAYGFGERCFLWLWKLIVDEMPPSFRFLEVGVYKGQILSLVRLLANMADKEATIYGLTLLSSFGGDGTTFPDEDYAAHIRNLHDHFSLVHPLILHGDSTDPNMQELAEMRGPYDVVFVDGCHDYDYAYKDLTFYPNLVKKGGYLVVDDSACRKKQPWGFFQGIASVCEAVASTIELDPQWEEIFCVVHDRVWRRK